VVAPSCQKGKKLPIATGLLVAKMRNNGGNVNLWYGLLLVGSELHAKKQKAPSQLQIGKETSHFYHYCFQSGLIPVAKSRNKEAEGIELWYG
jgi:hypothetical protein